MRLLPITSNIVEQRELDYAPNVIDLLNQALLAFKDNRNIEAENLYRRVLTLEPRTKEAYNNLATLYAKQDKHVEAKRYFEKRLKSPPCM